MGSAGAGTKETFLLLLTDAWPKQQQPFRPAVLPKDH